MNFRRSGGIILHPTSLPGPDGIGDLGPEAYHWMDTLAESGSTLWQILPLGPTGYGDSPYQSFSAFAGNPYLVSPTRLLDEGLLTRKDCIDRPAFPQATVDYGPVIQWKICLLDRAYAQFVHCASASQRTEFEWFQESHESWLPDFSLFMAIKESQGGHPWNLWPAPLRMRKPEALSKFRKEQSQAIERHVFRQYLFFQQWAAVRRYAAGKEISLIGDAPIFVAYDSADVWAHPELFYLNSRGNPTVVAGVPPDYFSPTGQLWGNPLYHWEVHAEDGYTWWIARLKAVLEMVDIIRLDHFRGFAGYYQIPARKLTAEVGRWVQGPGAHFFTSIMKAIPNLPIIAEDLGEITPDVVELRERFGFPGMRIFQFAFSTDPDDPFLPHNYPVNCVAYTGTHDNDTSLGWYRTAPEEERDFCRRYLARSGEDISWDMIRAIWGSVAMMALAPMQDFLSLGSQDRMNFPGKASGNWTWRMPVSTFDHPWIRRLKDLNWLYSRAPKKDVKRQRPERNRVLY